jgi:two-component system LytT family response regulator
MPEPLRLLIADDEPLARRLVRNYLGRQEGVELVAECSDGDELAASLAECHPDAALLDIRMPGRDVFEVLASIEPASLPLVVFATAHDRYAIRAFDVNAVDYLLKPYNEARFGAALDRLRERLRSRGQDDGLARALRDLGPSPDRLLVPHGGGMVPVAVADIIWIKSEGDYARIHTKERSYLVARTMNDLERRLDPAHFLRIHRSAIVRGERIREVVPEGSSRYRVVLDGGPSLVVSRGRASQLKRWML